MFKVDQLVRRTGGDRLPVHKGMVVRIKCIFGNYIMLHDLNDSDTLYHVANFVACEAEGATKFSELKQSERNALIVDMVDGAFVEEYTQDGWKIHEPYDEHGSLKLLHGNKCYRVIDKKALKEREMKRAELNIELTNITKRRKVILKELELLGQK